MNEELLRRFVREPDGSWCCIEAAELYLSGGRRIQITRGARFAPGSRYMGVEIALLLEGYYANSRTAGSGV
ncbi:MAG TPA: hypothetical protein VJ797_11145 [Burkholderiales bacterium]|nr:hypothetical protein [Burkholderiales bacterium]